MNGAGSYDAVVIGGGHNGLVAAAYLARARRRVLVLEASDRLGGMAGTRDLGGGLAVATAPALGLLSPRVAADLDLARHGLAYRVSALDTVVLGEDGTGLRLAANDPRATAESIARHAPRDAERLPAFQARLTRLADALRRVTERTPPRLALADWRNRLELLRLGWSIRRLGRADMRDLLRILPMNVADLAEEVFESDLMRGLVGFDAVLGNLFGPRSPNTVFTLLYRWAGAVEGRRGASALVAGGTERLIAALAAAAKGHGAEIRTEAPVARVLIEDGRAVGVATAGGEEIRAGLVLSSAHPRTTYLELVGPAQLDADFVRQVRFIRANGANARVDLVLGAPLETGPAGSDPARSRFVVAPGIAGLERAFDTAKHGGLSESPPLQAVLGEAADGRQVMSVTVQYAPARLRGQAWPDLKARLERQTLAALAQYFPGLAERVVSLSSLTPDEIAARWGSPGGHWHQVESGLDQAFLMRPLPGWAQYDTPIAGLLLCGAGCHPGGWITGQPGANAARRALAVLKRGGRR